MEAGGSPKLSEFEVFASGRPEIGYNSPTAKLYAQTLPRDVWADSAVRVDLSAIKNIVAVHRLREVSCLYGFTRFEAAPTSADGDLASPRCSALQRGDADPVVELPFGGIEEADRGRRRLELLLDPGSARFSRDLRVRDARVFVDLAEQVLTVDELEPPSPERPRYDQRTFAHDFTPRILAWITTKHRCCMCSTSIASESRRCLFAAAAELSSTVGVGFIGTGPSWKKTWPEVTGRNGTEGDQASLKPYIAASIFLPFDGGQELVPGIRAIPAPGHTPGHTSYMVESNGQALRSGVTSSTSPLSIFPIPPFPSNTTPIQSRLRRYARRSSPRPSRRECGSPPPTFPFPAWGMSAPERMSPLDPSRIHDATVQSLRQVIRSS